MSAWIHVRDLRVACIIGVRPEERRRPQTVVLNLSLAVSIERAARTDRLADTVDYATLKKRVLEHVRRSRFRLLERLADSVVRLCLRTPGVQAARVVVDKPGALSLTRSVAVEIVRRRRKTGSRT